MRTSSFLDRLIGEVDSALRTLVLPQKRITTRQSPAENLADTVLSAQEKKHISGLMRVNHAGEVCAQALYQGQALTARLTHIKEQMANAAAEEVDHLAWCEERLYELGSKPSLLNPIWYCGSVLLGAIAGLAGDKISLGFVAETERQVTAHLQRHLHYLPEKDKKTKAILKRMQEDEEQHANTAMEAGAVELPYIIKQLMNAVSKLMTQSSYYI
ncbi:TPA: 2-polyprenyl-3-methyl-6-methoxy-1,4-benzoquinone monooxygenase [Legionella pneumophila]|nr:2-polyprenyl-3-methyl-6-methoxy-1,4-benzoquinone monooxygenase [Legionella pneumophila]HAT2066469.1 2-polyprenyl-3-methyl-6-methoxy-1,4-benzoquinone monooxygenase [Legionella pneumophila]HAT8592310.1 2-polyprenyl-3-methyl-6-methoxy-1,4-benzoquinone monooxygenase [Legionella pneumophila]HAU1576858.1 2-polyprenyl-3-methyl-6-methoxy-1,4-benzoquinone monooxygenase [Legionella pneumophila]HAU1680823.1 2-polyprenyl-3-methyl-6-methoxy-1,4-benzoquinone monooxygenase [Legionella pneumophila]HAU37005